MKIVQINITCGSGSTGKICLAVSQLLNEKGVENYIFYTEGESDYPFAVKYAEGKYLKLQALFSRLFGNYGFNSKAITKKLITSLDEIKPDIVHLHNLHGHNVNIEMLFAYLKEKQIKIYWTFHDCWAFTGYCTHFDFIGCDKWRRECEKCPQAKEYSWLFDKSKALYSKKKEIFSGLDLTVITPSHWLGALVKESFLSPYEVRVINNGIDPDIFKPTQSDFREKNGLEGKRLVLGVSYNWDEMKGIDIFRRLSEDLGEEYQIALLGARADADSGIISFGRVRDQKHLAEIYTAADVFLNPTRQENFPTVNLEALACGTPVVCFDSGGTKETIDSKSGICVPRDDYEALKSAVLYVCGESPFKEEDCVKRAALFYKNSKFQEYVDLYFEEG